MDFNKFQVKVRGFSGGSAVKNPPAVQEMQVRSLGQEDPLEKEMATHSSVLACEILGQRILVGHSPWGLKESDMNEPLNNNKQQVKVMGLVQGPHFSSRR